MLLLLGYNFVHYVIRLKAAFGFYFIFMSTFQDPMVTTTLSRTQNMSLVVALDDDNRAVGDLYWDDGEARNVEENYFMFQFNCSIVSTAPRPQRNGIESDSRG